MDLNFPSYDFRVKTNDGKRYIFDIIRQKYVRITPEEWIRQNLLHYLIETVKYPKNRLSVEKKVMIGEREGRTDILLFDPEVRPWLIVEVKAAEIRLKQEVFDQVARYNIALSAPYLVICNGNQLGIAAVDFKSRKTSFVDSWPAYPEAAI